MRVGNGTFSGIDQDPALSSDAARRAGGKPDRANMADNARLLRTAGGVASIAGPVKPRIHESVEAGGRGLGRRGVAIRIDRFIHGAEYH